MIFQKELMKRLKLNSGRTALQTEDRSVTYGEVNQMANRVTDHLLRLGLRPQRLVGILLTDRVHQICSMIGVLNARCVFVLLDGRLPAKRLAAMVADLNLAHLIVSPEGVVVCEAKGIGHVHRCIFDEIVTGPDTVIFREGNYPDWQAEDSAYVYFTSGSTGTPKGIVGRNGSLLQYLQWEIKEFGIDNRFRVSQLISPYFDAFLRDVFVPLLAGGTLCIPPDEDDLFTPAKLVPWIQRSRIQLIHCVPSVFRLINNTVAAPDGFSELRFVLLSGERIIPAELAPWYANYGHATQLVNLYGATETTMIRSFYRIKPEDAGRSSIPIGAPISDTELLILDKDLRVCELYVPGELYIASPYTSKGYLNAPELTHAKFLAIKEDAPAGTVAFKTGDRARLQPGGEIELIGREDRQVKIRGIRVELDEIEQVLLRSGLIRNAVVMPEKETEAESATGEGSLIAFVIMDAAVRQTAGWGDRLGAWLEAYLPGYMLPADLVEVSEYPLLGNGKIDYQELAQFRNARNFVEPANETERKLVVIWKEILGDKPISTEDSFHQMGGNSLFIMRLIARIYKEFHVRISLNDLFNNLTLVKQAELIRESTIDHSLQIPETAEKAAYSLSSAQERIYYNYLLDKTGTAFNLPMAFEIKGESDIARISEVFSLLIQRHEILRARFLFDKDRLLQVIEPEVDFRIEEVDARDKAIEEVISGFIRPFDLEKELLIRCAIFHLGEGKTILLSDTHHIVCDGISQINLFADFLRLYNGETIKPLRIRYKDYAEWEYTFKTTEGYIAYREFWLKLFEGDIPKLRLPVSSILPGKTMGEGGSIGFVISRAELKPITDLWRQEEVTVFSGLFAVYFVYMFRITGQEDIVIGINTSGRVQEELEDVVGMFSKTLPIRYTIDPEMSFRDLVRDMHKLLIQANSRQLYDLVDIARDLSRDRCNPAGDLFETMFSFQSFDRKRIRENNDTFINYMFEEISAKFPLHLFADEADHSINFRFEYLHAYFTRPDMEMLVLLFCALIKTMAERPDARIIECIDDSEELTNDPAVIGLY